MSADLKETSTPLAEISQGPNAFEAFLDRNQKGLVVFAIVLALGAVGVVVYRGVEVSREESAGADLVKAEDVAGYQAVVDGSANTVAAGSAMVLLANSQWSADKRDEAIGTLQKFIATSSDHAAIPSAKANLAAKLMSQGKNGDATKIFEEIVNDPEAKFIAPFALISLGDMAQTSGDIAKAETSYAKVKNDFPDSPFGETANRRIAALKAKPPVEIEPPPAPPTPPAPDTSGVPAASEMTPAALQPAPDLPVPSVTTPAPEAPAPTPALPEQP